MIKRNKKIEGLDHPNYLCECRLCLRSRQIDHICFYLPAHLKQWTREFYDYVIEIENELEMQEAYKETQKKKK